MQKARIFLILGIWTAILPYLGFPYSWKNILFTLTGLAIIFFSYNLYKENRAKEGKTNMFDNFRENTFRKKELRDERIVSSEELEAEPHN